MAGQVMWYLVYPNSLHKTELAKKKNQMEIGKILREATEAYIPKYTSQQ